MRLCSECSSPCDDAHVFCNVCGARLPPPGDNVDPLLGRVFGGKYQIRELLGAGAMGKVYRAELTSLQKTVAIKVILPHLASDEQIVTRFYNEARAASRLNHPNSVAVLDFGRTEDAQLYLVMEFLRGRSLAALLDNGAELPPARTGKILRQVLHALAEAHHLGVIHRDMKAENIIVEELRGEGDFVKVLDFGLAKIRGETHSHRTAAGSIMGTPAYMSPEQARGDPVDARSDLYSVGVILYQMLTGRLPFEGDSAAKVVLGHLTETPMPPRRRAPERAVPETLEAVCLRAMEKEPAARWQSAEEFADALQTAIAARTPTGRRCRSCGAWVRGAAKFCDECGTPLAPAAAEGGSGPVAVVPPQEAGSGPLAAEVAAPATPSPVAAPYTTASVPGTVAGAASAAGASGEAASGRMRTSTLRPATRQQIAKTLPSTGVRLPLVLLGAEAWLETLAAACTHMAEGYALAVVGEGGIGKTRLLAEFASTMRGRATAVHAAGPDPTWAGVAWHAVGSWLRALLGLKADEEPDPRPLADTWHFTEIERAGLEEALTEEGLAGVPAEARLLAVEQALRRALAMQPAPMVLILDDVARCDGPSRELAARLADAPPPGVLLVLAHPPSFTPPWGDAVPRLALDGVPAEEFTAELADVLQGPLPVDLADNLKAGKLSPMLVEQWLRLRLEGGTETPSAVADVIALRDARLPADARCLLQAAAIVGFEAREETIVAVANVKTPEPALELLAARGYLKRRAGVAGFPTSLLRQVVEAGLPTEVARELHGRAAELLPETAPIEVLAHHHARADDPTSALPWVDRAAARAEVRGDPAQAAALYRTALELTKRDLASKPTGEEDVRTLLYYAWRLGESLAEAGQADEAAAVLEDALEPGHGGADDRARLLGALAEAELARGRDLEAEGAVLRALQIAHASGRARTAATLHRQMAELHVRRGAWAAAADDLREGIELLASEDDRDEVAGRREMAALLIRLGGILLMAHNPREALDTAARALRLAEKADDDALAARAAGAVAEAHLAVGDPRAAAAVLERAVELARRARDFVSLARWEAALAKGAVDR
ncbi:MAG TPA: protein kinase [Myxococcota bacterium]|jgi:serine/threonine-protein kinase|nr:protein kinase [Myxococcota bacterium]